MLKTKGAAIFNTHERPIKICMHKTEGLKRQALKGMFSLMYITNSLLKNKRMLLYECKKLVVAYYIMSFLHRIYKMKGLLKAYNHIGKNHDYDVDMQWQWLTGFSSCIKKCPHGIFSHEVVLRVTAIIRMLLFVYTDSLS